MVREKVLGTYGGQYQYAGPDPFANRHIGEVKARKCINDLIISVRELSN